MMKLSFLLLIAPFVVSSFAYSQSNDEKEVARAVELLRKALISGAEAELKDLVAEDLSYGHSSGKIEDKTAFIQSLVSGTSDFLSIDLTDQTIKIVDNTAVVRHRLKAETMDAGVRGNPNLSVLLIWQKQSAQWRLLARQATKVQ